MQIKTFVFNPFQVNTYLLFDETREAIVFDPAMTGEHEKTQFETFIRDNSLNIKGIYNTHGHMDHVAGSHWMKQKYRLSPQGHPADDMLIETAQEHAESFGFCIEKPEPVSKYLKHGDMIRFGKQEMEVRHVPGHSPGGLAFIHHNEKFVISGDSLFASSIGRTDLPGGNFSLLVASIRENILTLNDNYKVYPGHGSATSVGSEKIKNPFLS